MLAVWGDASRRSGWASVTKLVTALAVLVAVEEGTLESGRTSGTAGLDGAPPARPRVGVGIRRASGDRRAGRAADLLEPRLRGPGRGVGGPGRDAVRAVCHRGRAGAARHGRHPARGVVGGGNGRPARRFAAARGGAVAADAGVGRDDGAGDEGGLPGPRRCASGHRPVRTKRLGPRLRAPRRQVATLDRAPELIGHLWPLRRNRLVPVGGPSGPTSGGGVERARLRARGPSRPGRGSPTRFSTSSRLGSRARVPRLEPVPRVFILRCWPGSLRYR